MRSTTPRPRAGTVVGGPSTRLASDTRTRPARQGDLRAVAALWAEAEQMHAVWHPGYFRKEGRLEDRVLHLLEYTDGRGELIVSVKNGRVVGFIHVEMMEPKRGSIIGRRAHIDTLVVSPDSRRLGCGRRLVHEGARWAKTHGAAELFLTVWAGNDDAARFYQKLGLVPVSQVMKLTL